MTVSAARIVVSTSAVALNTGGTAGGDLLIKNVGAVIADLGAAGVISGGGFALAVDASVALKLDPGAVLFAISSGAGTTLAVLQT